MGKKKPAAPQYALKARVWRWDARPAWHFITVPPKISAQIRAADLGLSSALGSIPVTVQIGKTVWNTSLFPDSETNTFVLPIKASVRENEKAQEGKNISLLLKLGAN